MDNIEHEHLDKSELRQALLKDMKNLRILLQTPVTRSLYRRHGAWSERHWTDVFGTFQAFRAAADASDGLPEPDGLGIDDGYHVQEDADNLNITVAHTTDVRTVEDLVRVCHIDLNVWHVERFTANKWTSPTGKELYQIKAHFARRNAMAEAQKEVDALITKAKEGITFAPAPVEFNPGGPQQIIEIAIMDHHFGKLAWGVETGHENYDSKIARQMWDRAFHTLLTNSLKFCPNPKQILFVVGNDLLNSDDAEGRTTRGTYVATDGRYHKTFTMVRNAMIEAVMVLRQYAPVKVIVMPGNHDRLSAWHLGESLECFFHATPDVQIDNLPRPRKYYRWGNVLLGFTHGDKGKRSDYPMIMAIERPEDFGETKFREWHTGHFHKTYVEENHGVRFRILPALCPPDAWHSNEGYVGCQRTSQSFVWDAQDGLVAQFYYNDDRDGEYTCQHSSLELVDTHGQEKIPSQMQSLTNLATNMRLNATR